MDCLSRCKTPFIASCRLAKAPLGVTTHQIAIQSRERTLTRLRGRYGFHTGAWAPPCNGGSKLAASSTDGPSLDQAGEDVEETRWVRALILSYLASLNRSLFAAKCLVEVVVQMYREGLTLDDAKVLLSLASLQHGGQLLSPMDEEILLSWVAVIMIALELVGVPLKPEGQERMRRLSRANPAADQDGLVAGLRGMVKMAVDQFLAGTDLFRLQLQQSMAARVEGDAGGPSPAIFMLQQNTRLVIIALEVVRGMGLPTDVRLQQQPPPVSATQPECEGDQPGGAAESNFNSSGQDGQPAQQEQQQQQQQQQQRQLGTEVAEPHWVPGFVLACDPVALSQSSEEVQQRAAAVRLLISFMGSAQGWLYSAWDFVSECTVCYGRGWTADGVYGHLQDEEFAQSGGLAISVARLPGTANVTAAVFARWLSIVYMTLAQTGVEFPGASRHDGWAWVSGAAHMQAEEESSSTMEAYGLADFVLHTIRNEEQKEQAGRSGDIGRDPGQAADPAVEGVLARITMDQPQLQQQARAGFVRLDDPQLVPTSPSVVLMSQQISLVQMARQLVLQERAQATAAAPPAAA